MQSSVVLIPILNRRHHELPPSLKICLQKFPLPAHHKTDPYHLSTVFYSLPFRSVPYALRLCIHFFLFSTIRDIPNRIHSSRERIK